MAKAKTLPNKSNSSVPTVTVSVEILSWLKEDFGYKISDSVILKETIPQGTSMMDLLHSFAEKYPVFNRKTFGQKEGVTEYCMVIIHGKIVPPAELNSPLKQGDIIKLTPAFYGG